MRQFANDLLDFSGKSPASPFEVADPRAEVVVPAVLCAQDITLQVIAQEILFGREVVDLVQMRFQPDLVVASACVPQA